MEILFASTLLLLFFQLLSEASLYNRETILSITTDPFIVFSSNIFAILGLRALFFLLARMMKAFRYLKAGVSAILAFVGVKMLLADFVHISVALSLGVIAVAMAAAVLASVVHGKKAVEPK